MNEIKNKIVRFAKALKITAIIAKVFVIILIVVTALQIVAVLTQDVPAFHGFFDGKPDDIVSLLGDSALLSGLSDIEFMRLHTNPVFRKTTELIVTLSSLLVLLGYLNFFKKMISSIIDEQQPFSMQTVTRMRRGSYWLLLLVLINPVLGILLFLLMRFFSLIFEYGAYLQERAEETSRIQEEVIVSLAEITENKSEQTGQHIRRVSEYSRILGEQLGLSQEQAQALRLASTMHDLGKLMIPSEILEKPGRLTEEEFALIKKHPGYGEHLLHNVEGDTMVLAREIALEHHERVDGKGYPDGKQGDAISLEGRIVAVADVYDALTSRRSYKEAWDEKRAFDEIVKGRGTQFDAKVVDAFIAAHDKIDAARRQYADEDYATTA